MEKAKAKSSLMLILYQAFQLAFRSPIYTQLWVEREINKYRETNLTQSPGSYRDQASLAPQILQLLSNVPTTTCAQVHYTETRITY